MSKPDRLRSDVSVVKMENGILLRHGSEETLRLEGATELTAEENALKERGLLINTDAAMDWQVALCGRLLEKKILLKGAPPSFEKVFADQCLLGTEPEAGLAVTVEIGVDLQQRKIHNKSAWQRNKPWLWVQIPGPLEVRWCTFIPGETACAECLEKRLLACRKNAAEYSAILAANGSTLPAVPSPALLAAAGGLAAVEATRLLAGAAVESAGRLWNLDFRFFKLTSERLLPVPGCSVCV